MMMKSLHTAMDDLTLLLCIRMFLGLGLNLTLSTHMYYIARLLRLT